ncbi:MAG: S8 family serine peptidase, partial [Acidobacteriota bacterium]
MLAGNGNTCDTTRTYTRRFTGVAPQANLINLRVLDKDGKGTDSAVIRAIDRAIQLKTQHNIRVINL